ncbi:UNVERIFIED_CONTAM: hypothetical protein RMT77_011632 [Armadillidium vulgare]
MILMKMLLIQIFFLANFAVTFLKNNASVISFKHKSIKINTESSNYNFKNIQKEKYFKRGLSNTSKSLATRILKNISLHNLNDEKEVVGRFLLDILTYTLKEENILLLYDREVMNFYEWIEFLLYKNLKSKPHIFLELQEFDIDNYDSEIINGYKYAIICLIYNQKHLLDLFQNKTLNLKWAPAKLLIVSLDHQRTISDLIFDSPIQRSRYIFIAELTVKSKKLVFQTYIIYPFERDKTGISQWKSFNGIYNLQRKKSEIFTERTKNFRGRLLHLASVCNDAPLLYWDNKFGKFIGVNIEIFNIISKKLNFKYNVQNNTEDGLWGGIENNTITGMFRDIYHNNKDLIINFFIQDYPLQLYFDSSFPYHYEGFGFLCKIPDSTPVWRKIFMPFSLSLWNILLATIIVQISIIFLLMKFGYRCGKHFRLSTSFLLIIGIMFRQNVNITNKSFWYLLHVIVWIIGSFVIMSAYSGNLISFLTFPSFPKRIETVKELATSNLRIGAAYYGSPMKEHLLSSPIEDFRKLGKKFDYYPNTNFGLARGIELVKSNHHVLIEGNTYLIYLQNSFNISGETYVLKEQISKGYLSFYFKKHSSLTHPISSKLNRLIETGIYSRIFEKHLNKMKKARRSYKKV